MDFGNIKIRVLMCNVACRLTGVLLVHLTICHNHLEADENFYFMKIICSLYVQCPSKQL